jgi:peptidoglycan/xylan/chitin deacetylase (PgdA/CDA1 family)
MGGSANGEQAFVPVLLYHAITDTPGRHIAPFAVSPREFERQLDVLLAAGYQFVTFGELVHVLKSSVAGNGCDAASAVLRDRRLTVITFDDGYADFATHALAALRARSIESTLFVTTGWLEGRESREPGPSDPMLDWSQLPELRAAGVEIGAHSHSHPQLDTLSNSELSDELQRSKELLEGALNGPVTGLAYPHGYNGPRVRRMAARLGYESAAGVRNALHDPHGDLFNISRLTVTRGTDPVQLTSWLTDPRRILRRRELLRTRGWRTYRRGRAILQGRPGSVYR